MNENVEASNLSIKKAEAEILSIRTEIGTMGANDFEIPALNDLIRRLQKRECSPEFALKEARGIRSRKQEDH